jgi:HEAT repeat protein
MFTEGPMKYIHSRLLFFCLILAILSPLATATGRSAEAREEEQRLISVLESSSSLQEKDAACAQLKRIGDAACVPALARLLTDTNLSHSARYALEAMPWPEAGRALADALPRTSGMLKVGIIDSIGQRKQKTAVRPLAAELANPDLLVAAAAADALGRIGGSEAMDDLLRVMGSSNAPLHRAAVQAALSCANQLHKAGDYRKANRAFNQIYVKAKDDGSKVAAYRGVILSSGKSAGTVAAAAIAKTTDARQLAALQLVHELPGPTATRAFVELLPRSAPPVQTALIEGLGQRKDVSAVPAIVKQLKNSSLEVRLAALAALGRLGDATLVGVLTKTASTTKEGERLLARQALKDLAGPGVKEALLAQLSKEDPGVQAEAALALGERRENGVIPALLKLAQTGNESGRNSALLALSTLSTEKDLDSMVQLVVESQSKENRTAAAEALNTVYQRLKLRNPKVPTQALTTAVRNSSTEVRLALLPVCSGLSDIETAKVLTEAVRDNNPDVRAAAVRAVSDSVNPELLSTIAGLAQELQEGNLKSVAIAGFVRLATDEATSMQPIATKLAAFEKVLSSTLRPEQVRMILGGLGQLAAPRAVKLVEPYLASEPVRSEAAGALVKIAPAIADTEVATDALKKVLATQGIEAETRKSAQAVLGSLEARADYLMSWEVSGPYRKTGTDFSGLFDTVFAPENEASGAAKWALVQNASDPARPGVVDLLKALGGEQCVAYARTWVFSPKQQEARLEMGSDDGIKVWINGAAVYANNIARPLQAGSDKANVSLEEGWNRLMIKVTQNNQGWEFCMRFLNPDGSRFAGLKAAVEKP